LVTREEVRKRVGERELCVVVVQFGLVRKEIKYIYIRDYVVSRMKRIALIKL
jgi:hypothetical protein